MISAPPEYIIESHIDGDWCIIFDPVSGGEYYSFRINRMQSQESIKNEIQMRLNAANHDYKYLL